MSLNAFIVRPFGTKPLLLDSADLAARLLQRQKGAGATLIESVKPVVEGQRWELRLNFEELHRVLIAPALLRLRVLGETASAVVVAGNIREDMFNRLITADLVIADLSIHNPNVFYELGIRQAFRDKYTFLIRSDLSDYPFDLKTDRYFEYSLVELVDHPEIAVKRLADALRTTISSYEADSPVFKLLPQLEAEDRARFIAVPDEFREEVERARRYQRREHLSLLAVECEGYLWEVEGQRVVGRAQFESNFIDGAKMTWEKIVGRYPDDLEANTVLSTIYQRLSDSARSEQALARVSRARSLTPSRMSELRALNGRNLKEAWIAQWQQAGSELAERRIAQWQQTDAELAERRIVALRSPLLQRAADAYLDAFKADLNNSYAGLNALTMLVIQAELAQCLPEVWRGIQRWPADALRELEQRRARIGQLIATLEMALESDRERLLQNGRIDPWFNLLESAVMCIVSDQPEHVAQLFDQARHFAPVNAEESMRRALEVYLALGIGGRDSDKGWEIGTIRQNVAHAIKVLVSPVDRPRKSTELQRILMFVGLRLDHSMAGDAACEPGDDTAASDPPGRAPGNRRGFPESAVEVARRAIEQAVDAEIKLGGKVVLGVAAAANGGDLLFHEICAARDIPTRMCLALPRPLYVGQYVAPAGRAWVERFSTAYRRVSALQAAAAVPAVGLAGATAGAVVGSADCPLPSAVNVFTDANELPRWLQGKPFYNVGRRNNLWMLQHALTAAYELGDSAEITLLALWHQDASEGGIGGIGNVIKLAAMQGIKVHPIALPTHAGRGEGSAVQAVDAPPPVRPPSGTQADPTTAAVRRAA